MLVINLINMYYENCIVTRKWKYVLPFIIFFELKLNNTMRNDEEIMIIFISDFLFLYSI